MDDILTTCDVCEYTWDARTWTKCPRCCGSAKAYEPTQAEIRQACERIRQNWTRNKLASQEGHGDELEITEVPSPNMGLVTRRRSRD
jgi:hypothetical protein